WTFVVRPAMVEIGNQWLVNLHFTSDTVPGDFPYGDLNSIVPSSGNRLSANMRDDSNATRDAPPNALIENGQWYVVTVVWDGAAGSIAQYVNGRRTGYRATGATRTLPHEWIYLGIGNRYQGTRPFEGDIAEFALYNTALSDSERLANEEALTLKYGLQPHTVMPVAAKFGQV